MRLIISDLSEVANVVGRNGTFSIKELQIYHSGKSNMVFCDFVSRKIDRILDAGFWVGVEDMDRLAKRWLEYREQ